MRISRILITNWIALDCCLAAYVAGWLWTYREGLMLLGKDGLRWLSLVTQ